MIFTYETQGAITYLVCELEPAEQIDSLTLGMLTNNHIAGLAPVLYTEMNGQRFLKYNISAKVSADQFFSGTMNKQRALTAFQNILNAICSADEYMIDPSSFLVASERIFLNVSNCETAMICLPITSDKDINPEVAALFKRIMFSTQFDSSEDATYITQLITYINNSAEFTVYGLQNLVSKIAAGAPVAASAPTPAPVVQQAPVTPVQQPVTPVAAFDSTISIDDMPAMMAQTQPTPQPAVQNINIAPAPARPAPAPARPAPAPARPAPAQARPTPAPARPVTQPQPPVQSATPHVGNPATPPVQNYRPQPSAVKPQPQPVVPQKPPVQSNAGFAIPGQSRGGAPKVQTPPVPAQQQPPKVAEAAGEKKMSWFGLMSHYNKENAELYKKQKEEAKAQKAAAAAAAKAAKQQAKPPVGSAPGAAPVAVPGAVPNAGPNAGPNAAPVQSPVDRPPVSAPVQRQYTQPQYQPPVQPVPVQNSFNETTVLSPMMVGGETTVLSANPSLPDPCLTRIKTGERISINKPVFRIGKEKSYVDYFIGDNTAISRSHANIHTQDGEYFIEDTNSTNHTYINGKLITSNVKTKLVSGDKVRLANEDFTFSV